MASTSIRLHKQFGLNPTLSTCFYCGEETGEIALLGAAYKGEAPKHMCTSFEPCPKCKEKYKNYIFLVEAIQNESGKSAPTGRWVAIRKELVTIPNNGVCFITPTTFKQLQEKNKQ